MRIHAAFAFLSVLALSVACGPREPGPSEVDLGETQFWRVAGDGEILFNDACTDAESFRDDIEPPAFEPNSYLVFKIAEDGSTATAQDCERIDPDTCVDSETGLVFEVDVEAHTYTAVLEAQVLPTSSLDCDVKLGQTWTLEDLGETMTIDVALPVTLEGEAAACAAIEDDIIAQGTNGAGLDGCVITLHVDTEFDASL